MTCKGLCARKGRLKDQWLVEAFALIWENLQSLLAACEVFTVQFSTYCSFMFILLFYYTGFRGARMATLLEEMLFFLLWSGIYYSVNGVTLGWWPVSDLWGLSPSKSLSQWLQLRLSRCRCSFSNGGFKIIDNKCHARFSEFLLVT